MASVGDDDVAEGRLARAGRSRRDDGDDDTGVRVSCLSRYCPFVTEFRVLLFIRRASEFGPALRSKIGMFHLWQVLERTPGVLAMPRAAGARGIIAARMSGVTALLN